MKYTTYRDLSQEYLLEDKATLESDLSAIRRDKREKLGLAPIFSLFFSPDVSQSDKLIT
jgi:hypothetical protein